MKGLELARAFYNEYGAPMLHERFPECERFIAVGLVGAGSECFGYDDETSRDHDFEPGFCLFLPDEETIDRKTAFALERAYAGLPKEYKGFARLASPPAGSSRHGVIRTADFYREKIGRDRAYTDPMQWFGIPEHYLAEATNGEVFRDDYNEFSRIRAQMKHMPEDVRLKKLAGHLWQAGQSAPYNYTRCLAHGEETAAQWALYEFADHILSAAFLICGVYRPFYKWVFRALRDLPALSELEAPIAGLLTGQNRDARADKEEAVALICRTVSSALYEKGLLTSPEREFSYAAFEVNDRIRDPNVRNLNILYGI